MHPSIANTYTRFPVTFVSGSGCRLYDENGKEYLDFAAGIAVCSLGHCHPAVTEAAIRQLVELVHVSNLYWTRPQMAVAELLTSRSFADQVFFCNSGAEAIEAAIKLARRYGHDRHGPDCFEVVSLIGSFHGRTLGALAATGQPVYHAGFEPLPAGFLHVPANDIRALELAVTRRTAAVLLEPIQGEGGVRPLDDAFLLAARRICDEQGILLVFDEVQVGIGRTGTLFAYEQTPVVPDVLCLAKALGNGLPIGAMLAKRDVMSHLPPGSHASTFGGNPVSCAAAKAVLEIVSSEEFLGRVRETGAYLRSRLDEVAGRFPDLVSEVRGRGLIQAMELKAPWPDLANRLLEQGVLALLGHGKVLRLVPPLIVTKEEIDVFINRLTHVFKETPALSRSL
ncbi:MAG: aspartate aminotransferase family protein [Deltaproteobacteria bacterium]